MGSQLIPIAEGNRLADPLPEWIYLRQCSDAIVYGDFALIVFFAGRMRLLDPGSWKGIISPTWPLEVGPVLHTFMVKEKFCLYRILWMSWNWIARTVLIVAAYLYSTARVHTMLQICSWYIGLCRFTMLKKTYSIPFAIKQKHLSNLRWIYREAECWLNLFYL